MDLSDPHFRKTFNIGGREGRDMDRGRREGERGKEERGREERGRERLLEPSQQAYLPMKRGRFEQYKYRRMLLHNHEER